MKRIAIIQSSYIPWKGYFDIIGSVDQFVLLDDVQFSRSTWRNRNKIKTANGTTWLTIPVLIKGKLGQLIKDTEVKQDGWARKHAQSMFFSYSKAPHFNDYWPEVEALMARAGEEKSLSRINFMFIEAMCRMLGIKTPIIWSDTLPHEGEKEQRVISICQALGATHYLSGPAAADYIPDGSFEKAGIKLEYADYGGYPEYPQLHGAFEHYVTALDLLFHAGKDAPRYMKFRDNPKGMIKT